MNDIRRHLTPTRPQALPEHLAIDRTPRHLCISMNLDRHALQLVRTLVVRVPVHLVLANADAQSPLNIMLFILCEISSYVSQSTLFTPLQTLAVTLEHHALHLVRNLVVRVAVHLVLANADAQSPLEHHALHLVRNLVVRVPVHLVLANADAQSPLNIMLFILCEISSYASESTLFSPMQMLSHP